MGTCRFWVYIIASAAGRDGLYGFPIFDGVALAFYVVGLSYVARRESFRGRIPVWPLVLLAAPVTMAWMVNAGGYRVSAMYVSVILILWVVRCIRSVFQGGETNAGWIVSNLLAGIVIVDWLAVAPLILPWRGAVAFALLFGATKWLQKFVPAT